MTTIDAMTELMEKAAIQFGGELEEFHILRGKHDEELFEGTDDRDALVDDRQALRSEALVA